VGAALNPKRINEEIRTAYGVGVVQGYTERGILLWYKSEAVDPFRLPDGNWPLGSQFNKSYDSRGKRLAVTILEIPLEELESDMPRRKKVEDVTSGSDQNPVEAADPSGVTGSFLVTLVFVHGLSEDKYPIEFPTKEKAIGFIHTVFQQGFTMQVGSESIIYPPHQIARVLLREPNA